MRISDPTTEHERRKVSPWSTCTGPETRPRGAWEMMNVQVGEGDAVHANTVLAEYLAEAGFTQAGLADALNAVVEDLTGTPGRASDRWVRMLVDGSIRWPRHHYRQA